MGLFGRLFGYFKKDEEPAPERPFDIIAKALEAWQSGESQRAEDLFRRGIDDYRRGEPDGVDFALGRYGAFLLDKGRPDEASRVLEQAIDLGTDIPAIWGDYQDILANRQDLPGLFAAMDRMTRRMGAQFTMAQRTEMLLDHARRADRSGQAAFAEAVARRSMEEASVQGDRAGRWAAAGDLGHILERSDRVGEALELWTEVFKEGSNDPVTANRLSMHLERSKDYGGAIQVIRAALARRLPANVEEQLRKRLVRCEAKTNPGRSARTDVPAFSERHSEGAFTLLFQVRTKPPIKDLEIVGNTAHCLGSTKGVGSLVDIDLTTGAELRRTENLPDMGDVQFAPSGWGVALKRTARIGEGPTTLWFLNPAGVIVAQEAVPDATSQIAQGKDLWYVGCRDGRLYAFDFSGRRRWAWEVPGARGYEGSPYLRPCPYYVVATDAFATVASMSDLYAVSPTGATLWHSELPNERQTQYTFSVPLGDAPTDREAYRTLGLAAGAPPSEVKTAYRRLAMTTHPDRNPDDPEATVKFRKVQAAYEAITAGGQSGGSSGTGRPAIEISIEFSGMGPLTSFLSATAKGIVVGSSQGRLYIIDVVGRVREVRALGEGPVQATLHPDGSLAAALCDGMLFFFRGQEVINVAEIAERPQGMTMFGEDLLLWQGKRLEVRNAQGQVLWSTEFSRSISGVAAYGDTLVCAAGVIAAFRRADGIRRVE